MTNRREEKIKVVCLFINGMVASFDYEGKQMPEYQGPYFKVRDKVAKATNEATEFILMKNMNSKEHIFLERDQFQYFLGLC